MGDNGKEHRGRVPITLAVCVYERHTSDTGHCDLPVARVTHAARPSGRNTDPPATRRSHFDVTFTRSDGTAYAVIESCIDPAPKIVYLTGVRVAGLSVEFQDTVVTTLPTATTAAAAAAAAAATARQTSPSPSPFHGRTREWARDDGNSDCVTFLRYACDTLDAATYALYE